MIPLLLSDWLVKITWNPSSVSTQPHWMAKVTWNFSSVHTHSHWLIGITWKDSSVSVHSYWMIRGHMSGHGCPVWEPQFLLAVENQMDVFCGNVYSDWSVYYNHIHINIMVMSYSDVMLYHIFIFEWFCLHLLGLWLGGFNRLWISLWYEFL